MNLGKHKSSCNKQEITGKKQSLAFFDLVKDVRNVDIVDWGQKKLKAFFAIV